MRRIAILTSALLCGVGCKNEEKFPTLGDKVAAPVDVVAAENGERFYVLNADFDRTYNLGSILVLGKDGAKLGRTEVPRMGRSLTLAGNDLLVTIDFQDDKTGPRALLFDVGQDPNAPRLVREWDLECSPINAVVRAGYPYFFVGCTDGTLYAGELTGNRADSSLNLVRYYGLARRAMHIDTARGLLFAFPTDVGTQKFADILLTDVTSYDDNALEIPGPVSNEVPDDRESSRQAQSNRGSRQIHQFIVYDIDKEKAQGFPLRETAHPEVLAEYRWLYFKLKNFDGTPDLVDDPAQKYYRTNFWEAKADARDPNAFYLSHRGLPTESSSPHSNQIVRVAIVGDPRATPTDTPKPKVPFSESFLTFDRVFGFKGPETTRFSYPGDFEITEVAGQDVILVNNFRDLANWKRGDVAFTVAAKTLGDDTWFDERVGSLSGSDVRTYYQLALTREGYAATCSFYGNSVVLMKVTPGVGLAETGVVQ